MKRLFWTMLVVTPLAAAACGAPPPTGMGGAGGAGGAGGTGGTISDAGTSVPLPVTGTGTTPTATGTSPVNFNGTLNVSSFQVVNGVINAVGKLSGTITNTAGAVLGSVANVPVSIPLLSETATCQVLALNLGPLHLDLLGLVVDLNAIHLTINAQAAPGNLLGTLLCSITSLLNGSASADLISTLLNQVLGALSG